jgi:hypothetical protein
VGSRAKKLVVPIDNAAADNAKVTQSLFEPSPLKRLPQPLYSRDISPSDFYLFGKVKNAVIEQEIADEIGFLEIVTDILDGISDDELQAVFCSWIEHVQCVIDANGSILSW